jgi:hypothetical protein
VPTPGHLDSAYAALHQLPPPLPTSSYGLTAIDGVFWVLSVFMSFIFVAVFGLFCCTFSLFTHVLVFGSLELNIHHKPPLLLASVLGIRATNQMACIFGSLHPFTYVVRFIFSGCPALVAFFIS